MAERSVVVKGELTSDLLLAGGDAPQERRYPIFVTLSLAG